MNLNAQTPSHPRQGDKSNTAIVLVAFGSTATSTITTYEKITNSFKKAFPDNSIFIAYTSEHAIKKANESGRNLLNVNETVEKLTTDGYTKIIIQSLHIMNGEEFMSIGENFSSAKIVIGKPLLSSDSDLQKISEVLLPQCNKKIPTLIAAHGNSKFPELNLTLQKLGSIIESKCTNAVLCTIEGEPGIKPLSKITNQAKSVNSARIIPLMLVAGVHVTDDLIGTDPSSWKNLLGIKNVILSDPMGELPIIHEIYISHCKDALKKLDTL